MQAGGEANGLTDFSPFDDILERRYNLDCNVFLWIQIISSELSKSSVHWRQAQLRHESYCETAPGANCLWAAYGSTSPTQSAIIASVRGHAPYTNPFVRSL